MYSYMPCEELTYRIRAGLSDEQSFKTQDGKEKNINATGFQDDTGFAHLSKEPWIPCQEHFLFPAGDNDFGMKTFFVYVNS